MRAPHVALVGLAVANLALAGATWSRARPVTYVFTPLVDVTAGALDGPEAAALTADVKHEVDARDMQGAYARMGSTMSFDDLLRGIDELDDLTPAQKNRLVGILGRTGADREALIAVQREILDLESAIARQVAEIQPGPPR
jgi:hypothetical protein